METPSPGGESRGRAGRARLLSGTRGEVQALQWCFGYMGLLNTWDY